MRISSGPRRVVNSQAIPLPQNRGMARIAQAVIDTNATLAARKSSEAMKVDGYPVYVHKYSNGSQRCSCQGGEKAAQISAPTSPVFEDSFSEETALDPQTVVNLRGGMNANARLNTPEFHDLPDIDESPETFPGTSFDQNDDGIGGPGDDILDNLFPTLDSKKCGICGGTGYEDSYKWASGLKYSLTAMNVSDYRDSAINRDTRPFSLEVDGDSYVTWKIDVPAYFIGLDRWKAMDNLDVDRSLDLAVDLGLGAGFVPLSYNVFDSLKGIGGTVTVRAKPLRENPELVTVFTHIVLWLRTVELPYVQFPQLDRDINPSTIESLINTQFEIDPAVGALTRKSTIESPAHGRLWYVSNISNKQTSKNYVFNIQGSVTVVQPTSSLYGLAAVPTFTSKPPHNYRGIERGPDKTGLPYARESDKFNNPNALANDMPLLDDATNIGPDNFGDDIVGDRQTVNLGNTKLR